MARNHLLKTSTAFLVWLTIAGCGAATFGPNGEPDNNQSPIAEGGPDRTGVSTTQEVIMDGSGSYDPEGYPITYSWAFDSVPPGANPALLNATSPNPVFIADAEGDYYLTITVNDGYRSSTPDLVAVRVDNTAPEADAGDNKDWRTNCGGVELNAMGSVDPNGDPLTYQWYFDSKPNGSNAFILNPSAAVTQFVPDIPGTYVIGLIASDGKIDSVPRTVSIVAQGRPLATGDVLVADSGSPYNIHRYSPNGNYLGLFVDGSAMGGVNAYRNLYGITATTFNAVLVTAAVSQRVFRFSTTGSYQGEWTTEYTNGNVSVPQGITEGPNGSVLIVTWRTLGTGRHSIQEFNSGGNYLGDFKLNPNLDGARNIILACHNEFLVTNSGDNAVERYAAQNHDYMGALTAGSTTSTATGIYQLTDGRLLVSNFASSRVEILDPETGQHLGTFATASSGLSGPSGILQVQPSGDVWVTSTGNDTIRRYSKDGAYLGTVNGGNLADPIGLTQLY